MCTGVIFTGSNHPRLLMSRQGSEEVTVVIETHPSGARSSPFSRETSGLLAELRAALPKL